jgi:hypothetical protein
MKWIFNVYVIDSVLLKGNKLKVRFLYEIMYSLTYITHIFTNHEGNSKFIFPAKPTITRREVEEIMDIEGDSELILSE